MEHTLRKQPKFSITIDNQSFTVADNHRKGQSGTYTYGDLKKVRFRDKQVNVFVLFLDLLFGGGGSAKKDPWLLEVSLKSKRIRFYPEDSFVSSTKLLAGILSRKIKT